MVSPSNNSGAGYDTQVGMAAQFPAVAVANASFGALFAFYPAVAILPQEPYGNRCDSENLQGDTITFRTRTGVGINLEMASVGSVDELLDKNTPAFTPEMDVRSKITVRMQLIGYPAYDRQVMALRSTRDADSISIGKLACTVAQEMRTFMDGQPLRVGKHHFYLKDILLAKVHHVSRGSWQPEFWVLLRP